MGKDKRMLKAITKEQEKIDRKITQKMINDVINIMMNAELSEDMLYTAWAYGFDAACEIIKCVFGIEEEKI